MSASKGYAMLKQCFLPCQSVSNWGGDCCNHRLQCHVVVWTLSATVSVTRFKDLADQIGAGDPDTKLLLPSVGPVKTNLCEWFENKYTLYFWFSMENPDFSGVFSNFWCTEKRRPTNYYRNPFSKRHQINFTKIVTFSLRWALSVDVWTSYSTSC